MEETYLPQWKRAKLFGMNKEVIWTTKDGQKVPVPKMTDSHLLNAHRWLEEKLVNCEEMNDLYLSPVFAPSEGTIAADDLDSVMQEVWDSELNINAWLGTLEAEIKKRGLTILPPRRKFRPLPKAKRAETVKVDGRRLGIIFELEQENDTR